jgi:transcriptional regulator with XRE-family HTH domain
MMLQGNPGDDNRGRLASNLRRLRIARHLSLSQLARETAVSKGTLSGIESGHGNPTVDTLTLLADALGVSIAELLQEAPGAQMRVVRVAEAWPPAGLGERLLESTGRLSGTLETLELALPAHHLHACEPRVAGARDGVLVLQGKLIVGPVERISELAVGDYASFPADIPYLYETTSTPACVLRLSYTP